MKKIILFLLVVIHLHSCQEEKEPEKSTVQKPNIIYILADDLGYAEIGAFGQEKIETPNIDALSKKGMIFTQHYSSAPVCAPARYMFLTGKHSGNSFIRGNDEWNDRGDVWDYKAMAKDSTLEGQRPVPKGTKTIANYLQEEGYKTALVGKWGLGAPHTHSVPNEMGFDFFYGFNCQRQAHTYYPLHLYKNKNRVHLANDTIAPSTPFPKGLDPKDPTSYKDYTLTEYAPDLMFEELTGFVTENKANPFFLYWATPVPHVALQAPKRWVDYYIEKFGPEEPYLSGNGNGYFSHQTPHAAYAAMVSYFDENVGKLVQQLKDEGIYDNTLIVFTSDNGPSYAGGADSMFFESAKPFDGEYGRGKGFVYEGGIRVPTFFTWPGKIKAETTSNHASAHYDMLATFADVLDFDKPIETDGVSFLPTLLGEQNQEKHEFMYWEFPEYGGQVAIRMDDWKVIRQHLKDEEKPTLELYNLVDDPTETNNIAAEHPEILKRAAEIFDKEHTEPETQLFKIPFLEKGLLSD